MGALDQASNINTLSSSSGLEDYMKNLGPNFSSLMSGQKSDIGDFIGRYSGAINAQEPLSAINQRIENELNLPTLRQNANTINTAFSNIPYNYGSAARGFDVNANQLSRIISTKTANMTPAMNAANNALATAQNTATARIGQEQTQQTKLLSPYQTEGSMLNDYLSRQATGFTSTAEATLSGYLQKLASGVTLTQDELDNANRLATAKLAYDAQIESAKIGAQSALNVAQTSAGTNKYIANLPYTTGIYPGSISYGPKFTTS